MRQCRTRRKTMAMMMALVLLISSVNLFPNEVYAETTESGIVIADNGVTYTLYETTGTSETDETVKTATVTDCEISSETIMIPETILFNDETYTVTSIGERAFAGCSSLEEIRMPDSVISIGHYAFRYCSKLISINIPVNVKSIEDGAFEGCSGLETISIPSGVTRIGSFVFLNCNSLSKISMPSGITVIGVSAFSGCSSLSSISIPASVTSIGGDAFGNCNLQSIYYQSDEQIAMLESAGVSVSDIATQVRYTVNSDGTVSVTVEKLPADAIDSGITLPESIDGKNISSINYSDSVKESVDTSAISIICTRHNEVWGMDGTSHWLTDCTCSVCGNQLDDVAKEEHSFGADGNEPCKCGITFAVTGQPEALNLEYGYADGKEISVDVTSVKNPEIAYQWYENDVAINGAADASYTIPVGKDLGDYRYYCKVSDRKYSVNSEETVVSVSKRKVTVQIDAKERKVGEDNPVFTFTITQGTLVAGDTTDSWTIDISTIATKDSLVGNYEIGGTITSANYEITVIPGVLIVTNVPESSNESGNSNEPESSAPKKGASIKDSGNKAYYKVTKAGNTSGKVGTVEYVKPVKKSTSKVTIPATIKVGGIKYKVTSIAKNAFKNNKKITSVTIKSNVKTINANAFYGCSKLKTVTLGSGTTTIGNKAFYKCTSLTKITIPSKVSKIGKQAFYGCKKLKTITIKTKKLKLSKIGLNAFKGISSTATIKVPKSKYKTYKTMLKKRGVSSKAKYKKV